MRLPLWAKRCASSAPATVRRASSPAPASTGSMPIARFPDGPKREKSYVPRQLRQRPKAPPGHFYSFMHCMHNRLPDRIRNCIARGVKW